MGSILDYLDWRGDIPFSVDPFNYVDSLILTVMSYADLEGLVPGPVLSADPSAAAGSPPDAGPRMISLQDLTKKYWQLHTKEEVKNKTTLYSDYPLVLEKMCSGARFGGMYLTAYVNLVSQASTSQMSAVTCLLEDGTAYAAFRGTDDTVVGWKEDFTFSFMNETVGQKSAVEYLNMVFGNDSCPGPDSAAGGSPDPDRPFPIIHGIGDRFPIRVGGHSKGGNFAVYASALCGTQIRDRITDVYTFDGPGVLEEMASSDEYRAILPRVRSIVPEESVFGLLLDSGYYHKVIKSSEKGIWQHDAMSWQVKRNRLVEAPGLSEGSRLLSQALEEWIRKMPMEERRETVDALFSLFDESGVEKISDITTGGFKSIQDLLRAYWAMDKEDKKILTDNIGKLFQSGADSLSEELRDRLIGKNRTLTKP